MQPSLIPWTILPRQLRIVAAHRHVVQEDQRLGARAEAVVDRHRDQVDAHGRVPAGGEGQLELGADPVGRGDQHRVAIGARKQADLVVEPEKTGEPVLPVDHARRVRAPQERPDPRNRLLVGLEIHPGRAIVQRFVHEFALRMFETLL